MRKRYLAALAAALLAAAAAVIYAPSALSAPPTITRTPINATLFDNECGFPVQIDIVGTDLAIISGGTEFDAFPNSRATLTNLVTGRTITVSIAGPGTTTVGADGSVTFAGNGPTLFSSSPRLFDTITLLNGRFSLTIDAEGNLTFSTIGQTRDLCAELAG
jgi:hypothetical protein